MFKLKMRSINKNIFFKNKNNFFNLKNRKLIFMKIVKKKLKIEKKK